MRLQPLNPLGRHALHAFAALALCALTPIAVSAQSSGLGARERLQQMAGAWDVRQRMWEGPYATPLELPPAVAQRHLVRDTYLEEVMESAPATSAAGAVFTRHAVVNVNDVRHEVEYMSIDTRAPQVMNERGPATSTGAGDLALQGGRFRAPKWGQFNDTEFRYRLTIGPVQDDRQLVRLYLTPLRQLPAREFLAFEYVYTRRR